MKKIAENVMEEAGKKGVDKAIDLLVDKFVLPKLEKALNSPQDIILLRDLLKEYLNKKYDNDKYMNTIVFQHESKTIDELYIPLTIIQGGKKNGITVNENVKNIFSEPNKLLIIDTAGTGKSTLVKYLSILCVKNEWGIPFVIELRKMEKNQSIENFMVKEIQLSNKNIKAVDIKDLIRRGDFIFFFDGYDEILEENKTYITKEIREFVTYASNNNFILTSREDDWLSEFGDFLKYKIKPLSKSEAYDLIKKYDGYGETSKNLIEEIEKDENYIALKEFLGNPLMVSLLYLTYRYKSVLQYKKNIFYRQVFDALYDRHDTVKGVGVVHVKKSKLDSEDFRRVLCAMGFISMKNGMVEFDKDQVLDLIKRSINVFPEIKTNTKDFLDDILHAVPLFIEEGIEYKWAHKSFAEYFAAVFICKECKEHEEKILNDILKRERNQRFYNMLDFCYDIDYKAVVENLAYPILNQYVTFYDNMLQKDNKSELWEEEIFHRFISDIYLVKIDNKVRAKDRNIIDDYFEAWRLLEREGINSFSYANYLSKSENIILMTQRKCAYIIVKLLFLKGMDIFKKVKVKSYPTKFLKNINKIGVYNIFCEKRGESLLLNFHDAMMSIIYHSDSDFKGNVLDIVKCRNKIQEIEMEKKKLSNDFFSLV